MTLIVGVLAVWMVWALPLPHWVAVLLAVCWLSGYAVVWWRKDAP